MLDANKILIEPLVDGNISPQEQFCIGGLWFRWGDMSELQKKIIVTRKHTIAGASRKSSMTGTAGASPEEQFWAGIAELNNIKIKTNL